MDWLILGVAGSGRSSFDMLGGRIFSIPDV
jgi:hypothetical protein